MTQARRMLGGIIAGLAGLAALAAGPAHAQAAKAVAAPPATMAREAAAASKPGPWPAGVPHLGASQILEKHIAARGGAAWKSVQALQLQGTIEAGRGDSVARSNAIYEANRNLRKQVAGPVPAAEGSEAPSGRAGPPAEVELPFKLDVKRPHKSRLEIVFAGKTAWQAYDGQTGWKFRPFLNRTDVEPFTAEENRIEAGQDDLEGPLFGSAARHTSITVEGVEKVDGRDAYRLRLVARDGSARTVWVDTRSFLDVKVQGTSRRVDGTMRAVYVTQRDFRPVQGILVPFVAETAVDGVAETHTLRVEKVSVNPALVDALFTKPSA